MREIYSWLWMLRSFPSGEQRGNEETWGELTSRLFMIGEGSDETRYMCMFVMKTVLAINPNKVLFRCELSVFLFSPIINNLLVNSPQFSWFVIELAVRGGSRREVLKNITQWICTTRKKNLEPHSARTTDFYNERLNLREGEGRGTKGAESEWLKVM